MRCTSIGLGHASDWQLRAIPLTLTASPGQARPVSLAPVEMYPRQRVSLRQEGARGWDRKSCGGLRLNAILPLPLCPHL